MEQQSDGGAAAGELVSTALAAKAIGVAYSTLARWRAAGIVTPAIETAGGHARWDIEDLRNQLRKLRSNPPGPTD